MEQESWNVFPLSVLNSNMKKIMTLSLGGKQFINFLYHVRIQMLLQYNPEKQFQKAVP